MAPINNFILKNIWIRNNNSKIVICTNGCCPEWNAFYIPLQTIYLNTPSAVRSMPWKEIRIRNEIINKTRDITFAIAILSTWAEVNRLIVFRKILFNKTRITKYRMATQMIKINISPIVMVNTSAFLILDEYRTKSQTFCKKFKNRKCIALFHIYDPDR